MSIILQKSTTYFLGMASADLLGSLFFQLGLTLQKSSVCETIPNAKSCETCAPIRNTYFCLPCYVSFSRSSSRRSEYQIYRSCFREYSAIARKYSIILTYCRFLVYNINIISYTQSSFIMSNRVSSCLQLFEQSDSFGTWTVPKSAAQCGPPAS